MINSILHKFSLLSTGNLGSTLPLWSVLPFVCMLIAIAILPLACGRWWESNRNKGLISVVLGTPVGVYFLFSDHHQLIHTAMDYVSFIILLGSLFTISGGILLRGNLRGTPVINTVFLFIGAVIANLIGTTGASMLLIRPLLRTNDTRKHISHIPIFFIFLVSNIGGSLTPLGDPPLFLGFLHGVPFFWTFGLWKEVLLVAGLVLGIYLLHDLHYWRREA